MNKRDNIVVYGNELNKAKFEGFTATDMDLFMTLCLLAKDKSSDEVEVDFSTLRQMAHFRNSTREEFDTKLTELRKKIFSMTMEFKTDEKKIAFVLFPTYIIDTKRRTLTVAVNSQFQHVLNQLSTNFTMFDLGIFTQINGKYGKTLYRMLAQYRQKNGSGWWQVDIEEFKEVFDVPKSYKSKYMMEKVVNPAINEIKPYFSTIKCEALYEKKRGKPLSGFRFEFTKSKAGIKAECDVSKSLPENARKVKEQKKKVDKAKKTKFHNFEEHEYDFEEIEREMLEVQKAETEEKRNKSEWISKDEQYDQMIEDAEQLEFFKN